MTLKNHEGYDDINALVESGDYDLDLFRADFKTAFKRDTTLSDNHLINLIASWENNDPLPRQVLTGLMYFAEEDENVCINPAPTFEPTYHGAPNTEEG
jgi:hypothetical protein